MKHTALTRVRPLALLALLAALAACGTIDGIGRDISGASNRVSQMM
jgi:predicted small secreted protein